ncbi:hypothetical protein KM043_017932 [Ampulex compressa]|nr:hypothetical protein KM043_017932 [Ampulex compressa]
MEYTIWNSVFIEKENLKLKKSSLTAGSRSPAMKESGRIPKKGGQAEKMANEIDEILNQYVNLTDDRKWAVNRSGDCPLKTYLACSSVSAGLRLRPSSPYPIKLLVLARGLGELLLDGRTSRTPLMRTENDYAVGG